MAKKIITPYNIGDSFEEAEISFGHHITYTIGNIRFVRDKANKLKLNDTKYDLVASPLTYEFKGKTFEHGNPTVNAKHIDEMIKRFCWKKIN